MENKAAKQFLHKLSGFIESHELLSVHDKYLVALSGGADSVALLLALCELGYQVEAAHCNFNLRGEESLRDEHFCLGLCAAKNIPFHRIHFDTRAYASLHHVSMEMAARELRYRYFEQLRNDLGASGVCVAHHQDDQVETVIMHMLRGTGIKGLTGMHPRNGFILRPLLGVSRAEIVQFLGSINDVQSGGRGQRFVTDSSNLVADVMRNKVRLEVLPMLRTLNPSVDAAIVSMAEYMDGASKVLDETVQNAIAQSRRGNGVYSLQLLRRGSSPELLLFSLLSGKGFTPAQVKQIAALSNDRSGRMWKSKTHCVTVNRDELIIKEFDSNNLAHCSRSLRIPEEGNYVFSPAVRFRVAMVERGCDFSVSKQPNMAMLDAASVQFPLTIRHAATGDRFVPFGMTGSKLVSDFLTDRKKSIFEKQKQLVVTSANGSIVWLVGERTDNRFKVSPDTKKVLIIECETIQ